ADRADLSRGEGCGSRQYSLRGDQLLVLEAALQRRSGRDRQHAADQQLSVYGNRGHAAGISGGGGGRFPGFLGSGGMQAQVIRGRQWLDDARVSWLLLVGRRKPGVSLEE